MIGVISSPTDQSVVREFFELFKTPWEFYRSQGQYDAVVCTEDTKLNGVSSNLFLLYSARGTAFDAEQNTEIATRPRLTLSCGGRRLPLYGQCVTFGQEGGSGLTEEVSGDAVAYVRQVGQRLFARIGYDLFQEVRILLGGGQPTENAGIPTLELHIALLRNLITGCGVPLVEIPPAPAGFPFIACLTHDVDHASIRRHFFDHTMFGFLYRATVGSAVNFLRGRLTIDKLVTNWVAAAKLPFVYLGVAGDFWYQFDRYLEIEKGHPSTFFVIPFAHYPGRSSEAEAPQARGSGYDISHVAGKMRRLAEAGSEIGLHGIDAWIDSSRGRDEARRICEGAGTTDRGVRMHWLYLDEKSPAVLEEAGFSYDSTVGYNETIGYRAGTSQAFKPLEATRLLELPMVAMDTALFYPNYLNLSSREALERMSRLSENAISCGGALTVNWHDRSIAPERLWGDSYASLLEDLTAKGAWFATASNAVAWFRKRRSVVFEQAGKDGNLKATVPTGDADGLPPLRLRFHSALRSGKPGPVMNIGLQTNYVDTSFAGTLDDVRLPN